MSRTNEAAAPVGGRGSAFRDGVRTLTPGYFALVMATGIVSIACHLLGLSLLARGFLWLNVVIYATLWVLTALRVARYPAEVAADVMSHARGVGFFTTVAATCVLGSQFLIVGGMPRSPLLPVSRTDVDRVRQMLRDAELQVAA